MYWILAINYQYATIIWFYAPALLAFGVTALYNSVKKKRGWSMILLGILLSAIAALTQLSNLSVIGLDHNALYHLLQALALIVLYVGFCRIPAPIE